MTETVEHILRPDNPWETAYPAVAARIRAFLDANPNRSFGTTELAGHLWPKTKGMTTNARDRLFRCLKAIIKHDMGDYVTYGPASTRGFTKGKHTVIWRAPTYDL